MVTVPDYGDEEQQQLAFALPEASSAFPPANGNESDIGEEDGTEEVCTNSHVCSAAIQLF